jgi:hypothetical protein
LVKKALQTQIIMENNSNSYKVNPVPLPPEGAWGRRPSFSIYDASAGSGKTYAVKEYLKLFW